MRAKNLMAIVGPLIDCLKRSPQFLNDLIAGIPSEMLKQRRIPGKWSIHEHVCHLAQAEEMIYNRFNVFDTSDLPEFLPYLPGETIDADHLINLSMEEELHKYESSRKQLIDLLISFDEGLWKKRAIHHEYSQYNAFILLRHTLMHDHFHMYRIEELWLTKDEFL